ncbi:MAG: hypothetical protein WC749_02395 [Dehalococcoidia bacterium]
MATIKQHNNLIKVMFGHENYYKHILTNEAVRRVAHMEGRFATSKLPVCASCERLGLWHHGRTCYCQNCGTVTKNPITFAEYYVQGYDLDRKQSLEGAHEIAVRQEVL